MPKITVKPGEEFTLTRTAVGETQWAIPHRPAQLGPDCKLAFTSPGTRKIVATTTVTTTVTEEFEVEVVAESTTKPPPKPVPNEPDGPIVVGGTPYPQVKLKPGPQKLRRNIVSPVAYSSLDPENPAIIHGGFAVLGCDAIFSDLVFDGDTSVGSWSIKLGEGGSASGRNIEFRNVFNGLFCETPKAKGGVFTNLRSTAGVHKYPVGLFGARNITLLGPKLLGYDGIEHPLRINGQGGVASKNIKVIGGEIARANDRKEPITIRHGEDIVIEGVTISRGYALRMCYDSRKGDKDNPDVQSKNIRIRDCTLSCPIHVYTSGVDTLLIANNKFVGLTAAHAEAIHLNPWEGRTRDVTISGNTRDNAGAMVKNAGGIPNFISR